MGERARESCWLVASPRLTRSCHVFSIAALERGVPKETVFACANKFQLIEVGKKWGPELKIQFTED